jgi:UDP-2,3-diacylglucosamine hydrolase
MIHGHTHRPNKHHISNDQGDFTRYVLGDWSQKSAIIIKCTDENIELIELI